MMTTEEDMAVFARIRATESPQEALAVFMDYKQTICNSVQHATRLNCFWDLCQTIDYQDARFDFEQWLVDARKARAENAIVRGIIE